MPQDMICRWSEKMAISDKKISMTEQEIQRVLAPVASFIHDTYASGLIPETQFTKLVSEELCRIRKQSQVPNRMNVTEENAI